MRRRIARALMVTVGVGVLVMSLGMTAYAGVNGESNGGVSGIAGSSSQGASTGPGADVTSLSQDEIHWLTYLREEEKLARDVYLVLFDQWGLRIFENIAASEQRHTDAIKTLLDRYGVPDPVLDAGKFQNEDLRNLYNELVSQGGMSLTDALTVGVLIEETDIADLKAAIASTTHSDIETVYGNLLEGSLNHLDAFNSNLARRS